MQWSDAPQRHPVLPAALQLDAVSHAYHPGQWVLRNCALRLDKGRVLAILGPNGRGKTTLLKIILGALQPTEGRAEVTGRMAFVPQLFQVSFDYSALDMVLMGRARKIGLLSQPSHRDEEAALHALERFGLGAMAHRPFHEMSGGQRQLVIFARALVAEADILILDEPTSALDLKNQQVVLTWMDRLARQDGLTVIFTTHHPHHAQAVADEALLMLEGPSYVSGPVTEVLSEDNLRALYGVAMRRVAFEHEGVAQTAMVPVFTV